MNTFAFMPEEITFSEYLKIKGQVPLIDVRSPGEFAKGHIPGGTLRNWDSYGHNVSLKHKYYKNILCAPQTSEGLLLTVNAEAISDVEKCLQNFGIEADFFGELKATDEHLISVA